jgi:glycosyltransferase involved in cell wall biosynthesis
MPNVSVIMPCFNHGEFLTDSVNSILRQTHSALELIVVDDCSTDNSGDIIRSLAEGDKRIRVLRHEHNQGLSRSRNDALRIATGEFIAFCDSDDLWQSEKLSDQLELLRQHPEYDLVYGDTWIIDGRGSLTGQRFSDLFPPPKVASGSLFQELIARNFINIQSVLMRTECMQSGPAFDERIELVQDWWYWIKLSRRHGFLYADRPMASYRVHSSSTNLLQKRDYCVNQFRVFRCILRDYPDLSAASKADILFKMGVDLCDLGKYRTGRSLLWNAASFLVKDLRAFGTTARALRRLIMYVGSPRSQFSPATQ